MNETVQMALIVAIAVVIVMVIFRQRLSSFLFKATRKGVEAKLHAGSTSDGINISGNVQKGQRQVIDVSRNNVNVEKNVQLGKDQTIIVASDTAGRKKQ
jgi:hypothetical protein